MNSYRCNSELPAVWRHEGCDVLRQRRWTLDVDAVNILTNLSDQRSRHRQLLIFTWRFQQVTCCLCVDLFSPVNMWCSPFVCVYFLCLQHD